MPPLSTVRGSLLTRRGADRLLQCSYMTVVYPLPPHPSRARPMVSPEKPGHFSARTSRGPPRRAELLPAPERQGERLARRRRHGAGSGSGRRVCGRARSGPHARGRGHRLRRVRSGKRNIRRGARGKARSARTGTQSRRCGALRLPGVHRRSGHPRKESGHSLRKEDGSGRLFFAPLYGTITENLAAPF